MFCSVLLQLKIGDLFLSRSTKKADGGIKVSSFNLGFIQYFFWSYF